jgi:hypothetical protein
MPDIFRGIRLDPLVPSNSFYLLWMILGFLVVSSVLIVSLGRLGDMSGRVRIYNLGFVIYTAGAGRSAGPDQLADGVPHLRSRGTVRHGWAYLKLEELSKPSRARIDWAGNVSFAVGLILIMIAVTYGIRPYGLSPTGWGSPKVIALVSAGVLSLIVFALVERRAQEPMFRLPLFRIRAFTFGTMSTFLSAIARGGLMFMLIIWLQGIWLPQHGYDFTETPLWAGIYMLPLTVGMLFAGPTSGDLSDHFGARPFATGGMIGAALSFVLLSMLPTNFSYPLFAAVLFPPDLGAVSNRAARGVRVRDRRLPGGGGRIGLARRPARRRRHAGA